MHHFPNILLNSDEIISVMNHFSSTGIPFLFIIDSSATKGYVFPDGKMDENYIRFKIRKYADNHRKTELKSVTFDITPVSVDSYSQKFNQVKNEIQRGNSFLVNLTQPTVLNTDLCLTDFYDKSEAPYKLWLKDQFVVFSPETFVKIADGNISTYPMKGTIDASIPDAANIILNDIKEMAEHATIVDLLRNDLSMVAEDVKITRYRYVEKINTHAGELLQVSSEICGKLPADYLSMIGDIVFRMLPAGSVTGAPKPKTMEIIKKVEGYDRGFYTGVFGYFDGKNLDSAVMIRFVEQTDDGLIFKSGGGITYQSEMEKEYQELIQKVYVPVY